MGGIVILPGLCFGMVLCLPICHAGLNIGFPVSQITILGHSRSYACSRVLMNDSLKKRKKISPELVTSFSFKKYFGIAQGGRSCFLF